MEGDEDTEDNRDGCKDTGPQEDMLDIVMRPGTLNDGPTSGRVV